MNLHLLKGMVMWYMHLPFRIKQYQKNNDRNLARIRKKDKITVVFFASNVAMWRYQGLYEEMQKYPRFDTHIVLTPLKCFSNNEQENNFKTLRLFFQERGIDFHDFNLDEFQGCDVMELKPDIMFYTQPYYTINTYKQHRYYKYKDALLGYYPYGFNLRSQKSSYDEDFHNRAWRLYYENEYSREDCRILAAGGDLNVRVVGYPNADKFIRSQRDVWKHQSSKKRRIIWAPHFTIYNDGWSQNSGFLWMADKMVEFANLYRDKLQFAFKPHPRLLSELYKHPEWGKKKTDEYYSKWANMENTQLELSDYVDLFMSSDAMIHDCGSFAGEYMYTGNPVMFVIDDINKMMTVANTLGKKIYGVHYHGKCIKDIEGFIVNVVLREIDPKKQERQLLRNNFMLPPNGKTVAENTMNDLLESLS